MPKAYYRLLEELQAVDFVLVELNLYLDTHPQDLNALKQYNRFAQERKKIAGEFEFAVWPFATFRSQLLKVSVEVGGAAVAVASVTLPEVTKREIPIDRSRFHKKDEEEETEHVDL